MRVIDALMSPLEKFNIINGDDGSDLDDLFTYAVYGTAKGVPSLRSYPINTTRSWDKSAALPRLRRFASRGNTGKKDDMKWGQYASFFLFVDDANKTNFGGYKLPVVDIVNGKPTYIWNAVRNAAARANQVAGAGEQLKSIRSRLRTLFRRAGKDTSALEKGWGEEEEKKVEEKEITKTYDVVFKSVNEEERIVYGIVLEPDVEDAQGDVSTAEFIRKTAHDFMVEYQTFNVEHEGDDVDGVRVAESFIAPADFTMKNMEGDEEKIKRGSWVLGTKVLDDDIWEGVKKGDFTGYSIEGVVTKYVTVEES